MTRSRAYRWAAFTLIELLVVLSVIVVLVSLLLPSVQEARITAGLAVCLSGGRNTSLATLFYVADNLNYFPSNPADPSDPTNWFAGAERTLGYQEVLRRENYTSGDAFTNRACPYGPDDYSTGLGDPARVGVAGYPPVVSHGLMPVLQSGFGVGGKPYPQTAAGVGFAYYGQQKQTMPRIAKHSNRVVVITCSGAAFSRSTRIEGFTRGLLHMLGEVADPNSSWEFVEPQYIRHGAKALPMVMADGHGQLITYEQIVTDRLPGARPYQDPGSVMYYSFNMLWDSGIAGFNIDD